MGWDGCNGVYTVRLLYPFVFGDDVVFCIFSSLLRAFLVMEADGGFCYFSILI